MKDLRLFENKNARFSVSKNIDFWSRTKSYGCKELSTIAKQFFCINVKNHTEYGKPINTNNSFGKIGSTSVPGGNQVDGSPPASSTRSIGG